MFSKALFKQSCKANGLMWAIITFAVCFMLACVMLISGGGSISGIKNGVQDTIIKSQIDASCKTRAFSYYEINMPAMEYFDSSFKTAYAQALLSGDISGASTTAYLTAVDDLNTYVAQITEAKGYAAESEEAQEIQGIVFYTLNPNGQFNFFYEGVGEEPMAYDMTTIASSDRDDYRKEYCREAASIFLAGNMTGETAVEKMVEQLSDYGVDREKYDGYGYDYATVKELSETALVTYAARLEYALSDLNEEAEDYAEQVAAVKEELVGDLAGGFLATLPQEVSDALEEIGGMDLYNLIVGSIFYKMAGLLLPFIYVIMVSNSLIAGQVDSGSMAYILSTSTKRNEVTFTQGLYLVLSLFAMTLCTTITSCICLAVVKSSGMALTYGQLILMNLGSFAVLFAVSGICFLSSCWFNRSKSSMAIGGGITMFFLVATMLGLFGSPVLPTVVRLKALNFFNYVSIISLFDVISILDGTLTFIWKLVILFVVGLVCYLLGAKKFHDKDLPL